MPDINSPNPLRVAEYRITQVTAAQPGWVAAYDDPDNQGHVVTFPVCAFGIVMLVYEDGKKVQTIRHLVALPTGEIHDAYEIENFICVVGPSQNLADVVAIAKANQQLM